ncbi:MAG: phosphoribosylglycinamide formyltransferase [Gemmatimonadetes bacterium]|nr:phosphoribosylglycinamide formyltransferase [Gemmatimonadota bacterium]
MTDTPSRLAVLASGGGSNLQSIIDHFDALGSDAPARVALVVSDRESAGALERARTHGIPAVWLPRERSHELGALLAEHRITHVALAGYLRLVPPDVVTTFRGRLVNVHPALLPAFGGPGMYSHHVHEAVLRAGATMSGPTVHFVSEKYDEGAIIAQWRVPVRADDTPGTLATRVLAAEHFIYPRCLASVCAGRTVLAADGTVTGVPTFHVERAPSSVPGSP